METHQQRNAICKLKEKVGRTYYQVKQIEIDERPRLQKLQNVFKIEEITNTANEAMAEILAGKDLNMTELNHLTYTAAAALTEEVNGTGSYKSETQTPPWVRRIQESKNGIRKELSALAEIKRNYRNTNNKKRKRLLRKYKIETKENLDQAIEELKKYQQRHSDCLETRKDKSSTTKIKYLEHTARNFATFSYTQISV
jgi:hypothetical protein